MKRARSKIALLLAAAMVMTGIQVPVYGATDENVTIVAEEAVEMNEVTEEVTEETTQETPVGADSTIYVRSAAELVTALNGKDLSGQPLPTNEKIRIQMVAPLAGSDYKLTKELLGGKNLTIKEGADITLDLNGNHIAVSANAAENKIEVPKDTSFSLEGDVYNFDVYEEEDNTVYMGIVNRGILNAAGVGIYETQGDSIVNEADAVANLSKVHIKSTVQDTVAVRNAGSMTIADGSFIESYSNSYVAIENTGEILINGADIDSEANEVSSCGIKNIGVNANLSIRGTIHDDNSSKAYGIFNDAGTVTIGAYAADANDNAYIKADKCAVLTVNGGTVIGYEGMNVDGTIATTPFAGNEVYTGTTDGVFKMLGGTVKQITYSADSLPILVGGIVGNVNDPSAKALNLMVDVNGAEPYFSKYTYLTEEAGTPVAGTYTVDEVTKVAYAIVDGKVYQEGVEPEIEEENWILVSDEASLRNAVVSGGSIKLTRDISLSQNLVIAKDVEINLNKKSLTQFDENVAITVAEGVNAEIADGKLSFTKMKTDASAITNSGNLRLDDLDVSVSATSEDVTGAKAIMNHGALEVCGGYFYNYEGRLQEVAPEITVEVKNGIGIDNAETGIVKLSGSAQVYGENRDGVTAIYNTGKFIMKGGTVRAIGKYATSVGYNNYAIAYTDDHYPVLQGGTVYGTGYNGIVSENKANAVYGSAVVKAEGDGVYSRGYYQISDSEKASKVDGQNAYVIENGEVLVDLRNEARDKYLLLQSGDVVTGIEEAFDAGSYSSIVGVFTRSITSSNPTIASVTQGGTTEEPTWTLSANMAGYTTLEATYTFNDKTTIEDYLRIEVTDDKGALTAEDYKGSLLENQVTVNAYANKNITYEVPFEFHLDTSDMETATGASYWEAKSDSFEVSEIIIDDKEFNQYFDYDSENGSSFMTGQEKKHSFMFSNKTSNSDASTKLLDDEVKSIDQVEVKAKITNGVSEKDIVISLGYLDINVQAVIPVVKANGGFTLNSAYSANAYYYDDDNEEHVYPNLKFISFNEPEDNPLFNYITASVNGEELQIEGDFGPSMQVSIKSLSDGISSIYNNVAITANAKKGKETITAEVALADYVGAYQVKIPVTVTNKYPKVSLDKKTVTVASKSSAETDIPLYLYAKDAESAGMVENVQIVTAKGKTSNYAVVNKDFNATYYDEESKTYNTYGFYLQPKSTVNKAETVTLNVTYKATNAKAGKAYSTIVKVKVKPVNKFTMKQNGKTSMSTTVGSYAYATIKTTPEYFQGAKLVVTALNGQTEIPEEVAGVAIESSGDGTHALEVIATEATKSRGKKLEFGVAWVDETGKTLTGTKTTKVTVSLFDDTAKITSTTPSITVQPEKIYKKEAYLPYETYGIKQFDADNTTYVEYTAPVKFAGSGADAWDMIDYSDKMFNITYDAKKIILTANNKVIGGTQYTIPLEFVHDRTGEKQTVNLTVKVNDVKKVSAKFNTDTVTLYKEAPYAMQYLMTALGNTCMTNPAGGAGLTEITNVEIVNAENSPFEIYEYTQRVHISQVNEGMNVKDIKYYGLTFKDKKYPTGISAKSLKTVTVKITYGNGIEDNYKTALVKLKVNVK